jgi:hypothetical protein
MHPPILQLISLLIIGGCRLAASGERQGYYGCQFTGYQDTLYAREGIQYYSNSYIEGTRSSPIFIYVQMLRA